MCKWQDYILIIVCLIGLCGGAVAQGSGDKTNTPAQQTQVSITASASGERVRITGPASVVQMHVEVYNALGEKLFDNELRGGNVFDWHLQDGQGARLVAGDYLCVITTKNIAGKLTQKIGNVRIEDKTVTLGTQEISQLTPQQSQVIGPIEDNASWAILAEQENQTTTVVAHDGQDGQVVRGRGALSFRLGNFFTGNDQEQMRLTEAGDLGIGTAQPKFKLDVAGAVRARQGFVFNDGSVLNVNDKGSLTLTNSSGTIVPNVAGTGTPNNLVKWTDSSGTLGDSAVVEVNGNVGIGLTNPAAPLHIFGSQETVRQSLSNTSSFIQFAFFEGATKKGAFGYQGSTSSGFVGGPGAMVFGTLTASPVAFFTNGTEKVRLDTIGNLGIGTAAPAFRLDVNDPLNQGLRVQTNTSGGTVASFGRFGAFRIDATGDPGGRFTVLESGAVGIGDDFPDHKLSVLDPGNTGLRVHTNTGGGTVASFGANGAFQIDKGAGPNSAGGRFTVLENGNVGIGTNAPATALHVVSPQNPALSLETTSNSFAETQYVAGNYAWRTGVGGSGVINGAANKYYIYDVNAGQFRMAIDTAGNVGIGTASPQAQLHLLASSGNANFFMQGQGFNTGINFAVVSSGSPAELHISQFDGTYRDVIIIDNGGFVTLPRLQTGGNTSLCLNGFNQISTCGSSSRYKTNISSFSSGLSLIRQLSPISFDWKKDGMHDVGFGAEDVAKINPLFVTYNKDGQVEGVKYDRLSTVFVNAFKEQQTQIEQQQNQIKKQEAAIKQQQSEIDALKKLICADHPTAMFAKCRRRRVGAN